MSQCYINYKRNGLSRIFGIIMLSVLLVVGSTQFVYAYNTIDFQGSYGMGIDEEGSEWTVTGIYDGKDYALRIFSSCTVTLDNVNVSTNGRNTPAFSIRTTVDEPDKRLDVTLIIVGDNYISSETAQAISAGSTVYLTITGEGTLTVQGGGGSIQANNLTVGPSVTLIGYENENQQTAEAPSEDPAAEETLTVEEIPAEQPAEPTASTVMVDGLEVAFGAYNINGSNYFMLRDLALAINGTPKQFDVSWDEANNAILLISQTGYTASGNELQPNDGSGKTAVETDARVMVDGNDVRFNAYNIDGSNYFMLRDLAGVLDFHVGWDSDAGTISIDTGSNYQE